MDEKYYKRFESFSNSLNALAEAKTRDLSDSFVISGTGAKFCITLDLAWKTMKDIKNYNAEYEKDGQIYVKLVIE